MELTFEDLLINSLCQIRGSGTGEAEGECVDHVLDRRENASNPKQNTIDPDYPKGVARAEGVQGTPIQSHISPTILVYEVKSKVSVLFKLDATPQSWNIH